MAAHCGGEDGQKEDKKFERRFLAGRHNFSVPEEGEQIVRAVEAFRPPDTNDSTGFYSPHDLKLLKVDPPFKFNDHISPVKLPTKSYNIPDELAVIVGVGYTDPDLIEDGVYLPEVPSELEMSVLDRETCKKFSADFGSEPRDINEFRLCLHNDGGFQGPCYGDSGSPALKVENGQQILIGITEAITSNGCTGPTATGVYMDVFSFINWIRETTGISE